MKWYSDSVMEAYPKVYNNKASIEPAKPTHLHPWTNWRKPQQLVWDKVGVNR